MGLRAEFVFLGYTTSSSKRDKWDFHGLEECAARSAKIPDALLKWRHLSLLKLYLVLEAGGWGGV